ncbi:MAG: hypothetical protein ABUL69_03125 [Peristeroidobacter soli]
MQSMPLFIGLLIIAGLLGVITTSLSEISQTLKRIEANSTKPSGDSR